MDHAIRQRMALHLRSEKALGLQMVPVRRGRAENVQRPTSNVQRSTLDPPARSGQTVGRRALDAGEPVRGASATRCVAAPAQIEKSSSPTPAVRREAAAPVVALQGSAPFDSPVLPAGEKHRRLKELHETQVEGCTRCVLCETRTNVVFGEGNVDAEVMFIGEGPGETEDRLARPFVGKAGQKLDEMIKAMGLKREEVYIANVVKCRPPGNRTPAPDEVAACTPFLLRQIELVRPKIIVTLGVPAMKFILQTNLSLGRMRGRWHEWRGIKVMPTYHPAYILRYYTREVREAVWSDLKAVMAELERPRTAPSTKDTKNAN